MMEFIITALGRGTLPPCAMIVASFVLPTPE